MKIRDFTCGQHAIVDPDIVNIAAEVAGVAFSRADAEFRARAGIAGEVVRSDEAKNKFKLKYIAVYPVSSMLVIGFTDSYQWPIGIQIGVAILGGFLWKEVFVFATRKVKKKIWSG